ncbi:MAG: UvrD-helicase domain-containing protein [Eubacteriales bacterium]|nr:UvrD-helicase domain-containing protein [Clostridiales bacterium]MDY5836678.1 UvrD-helicase domain-containing protein [Eubacteriales bacterium]
MQWTEEQKAAIYDHGPGELLVSAAAGSGKTAVLTERIIQTCLRDQLSPEALVVLTFTDKAASNMRQRLVQKLRDLVAQKPGGPVQKILDQLPLAAISTIHAFCLRLLQDHKDALLDDQGQLVYPGQIRTLDAGEARLTLEEALDQVLAQIYQAAGQEGDPEAEAFFQDLQAWRPRLNEGEGFLSSQAWYLKFLRSQNISGQQTDDQNFRDRVLSDYLFLRSLPDYQTWCQEAFQDLAQEERAFASSQACAYFLDQLPGLVDRADQARSELEGLPFYAQAMDPRTKSKQLQAFQDKYPLVCDFIQAYRQILATGCPSTSPCRPSSLGEEDKARLWDLAQATGEKLRPWPAISSSSQADKQDFRAVFYSNFGPLLQFLADLFTRSDGTPNAAAAEFAFALPDWPFALSLAQIRQGAEAMLPVLDTYLATLFALDQAYQKLKQTRQQIDFSDYEHLAYQLLQEEAVRDSLASKYQAILIDEYQDTSPLQEALLQALLEAIQTASPQGEARGSLTMLGDIKQSIYRFRHANPDIFRRKLESFALLPAGSGDPEGPGPNVPGRLLLLKRNFRSQPALLASINDFFASFLRLETGEINYDDSQSLVPGRTPESFPRRQGPVKPFNLVYVQEDDPAKSARPEGPDASQLALYKAVCDLEAQGFQASEIAILARTHKLCQKAQEALAYWQIDSRIKQQQIFLQSDVQRILTSLVQVLANFAQDIPLTAILRSDLHPYGFREDDLFKISRQTLLDQAANPSHRPSFSDRFLAYAQAGEDLDLRSRCQAFLTLYQDWRAQANYLSLADLLRRIVESSTWLDRLMSQPFAGDRLRDWEDFLSQAEAFGRRQGHSLTHFAHYLESLADKTLDFTEAEAGSASADRIEILTLHAAKGLEFPAVIYFEANHVSRDTEKTDSLARLPDLGLAANYPWDAYREVLSPRRLYFNQLVDFRQRAEDYRLLYVTMTRAEEVLYFTGSGKGSDLAKLVAFLKEARQQACDQGLTASVLARAKSDLDLLLASLSLTSPDLVASLAGDPTPGPLTLARQDLALAFYSETALASDLAQAPAPASLAGVRPEAQLPEAATWAKAAPFPLFPETSEVQDQVAALLRGDGLGPDLSQVPAKLTVSELKDQLGAEIASAEGQGGQWAPGLREMALDLRRPDLGALGGLDQAAKASSLPLSPSQYGSLLHQIFQRLRPQVFLQADGQLKAEAEALYGQAMEDEIQAQSLPAEAQSLILEAWPFVQAFLASDLGRALAQAESTGRFVARELPFTLALPPAQVVGPAACPDLQRDPQALSLVQGMIDLFFDQGDGVILIDYKSDRLKGSQADRDQELTKRYQVQLDYYARAITQLRDRPVQAKIIWLIREGRAVYLT